MDGLFSVTSLILFFSGRLKTEVKLLMPALQQTVDRGDIVDGLSLIQSLDRGVNVDGLFSDRLKTKLTSLMNCSV